jgi:hypothetical protein
MSNKYLSEWARNKNRAFSIFGLLFIAIVLLTICIMSNLLPGFRMELSETPTREMTIMDIPTAIPASHFSISLPVILSPSGSVSVMAETAVQSQIWEVIKIRSLGYELDGQRYDVAVFRRIDSQDTVKAYCIDRGRDTPDLGTEYLRNPDGIFVPLQESEAHSFQRFLIIQ